MKPFVSLRQAYFTDGVRSRAYRLMVPLRCELEHVDDLEGRVEALHALVPPDGQQEGVRARRLHLQRRSAGDH